MPVLPCNSPTPRESRAALAQEVECKGTVKRIKAKIRPRHPTAFEARMHGTPTGRPRGFYDGSLYSRLGERRAPKSRQAHHDKEPEAKVSSLDVSHGLPALVRILLVSVKGSPVRRWSKPEDRCRSCVEGVVALVKLLLNSVRSSHFDVSRNSQIEHADSPRCATPESPGLGLLARPPSPSFSLQPDPKDPGRRFWIL
jgi:hypothetical protein